jgi:gamma-glutamylcyclotransferase (GGCT)/AIG2-like uncharacterized protein YtfP
MKKELYFAYGSNLHPEQMKGRCPDSSPVGAAVLFDYQLIFRRVADIIPCEGEAVTGAVYMVSEEDKKALDIYEGYPRLYNRVCVPVLVEGKGMTKAFLYIMNGGKKSPPPKYYFDIIKQGYRHWGLSFSSLKTALKNV